MSNSRQPSISDIENNENNGLSSTAALLADSNNQNPTDEERQIENPADPQSQIPPQTYRLLSRNGSIRVPEAKESSCKSLIKKGALLGLSLSTAFPTGINAMVAATNSKLEEVGMEWVKKLNPHDLFMTLLYLSSSLWINTLVAVDFLPKAFDILIEKFKEMSHSPRLLIKNSLLFLLTVGATIASGAISYSALRWASHLSALIITLINCTAFFATRYVGITRLQEKIWTKLQQDGVFEKNIENLLYSLSNITDEALLTQVDAIINQHLAAEEALTSKRSLKF